MQTNSPAKALILPLEFMPGVFSIFELTPSFSYLFIILVSGIFIEELINFIFNRYTLRNETKSLYDKLINKSPINIFEEIISSQ